MVARKLPLDLEEGILVRVPPRSLLRFRSVSKEWNTLLTDKRFANINLAFARPEFMLTTTDKRFANKNLAFAQAKFFHNDFKNYSISVNLNDDPTIKVRDSFFDFSRYDYGNSDGYFFLYDSSWYRADNMESHKGGVLWNPLFRKIRWIPAPARSSFTLCGVGYNGSIPDKIVGTIYSLDLRHQTVVMFEFETNAWKLIDPDRYVAEFTREQSLRHNSVSLNGNFYWTAYNLETGQYFIRVLDVLKEIIKPFCILPCMGKSSSHTRVLAIYKGDRFSVLEQCKTTCKIEIWVTKKKISNGDDVVWIRFMNVSIHNFPRFYHKFSKYMVDNNIYGKTLVMCCSYRRSGQAYVYIVRGDMCKRIKIDEVPSQFRCSIHVPSLIPIC